MTCAQIGLGIVCVVLPLVVNTIGLALLLVGGTLRIVRGLGLAVGNDGLLDPWAGDVRKELWGEKTDMKYGEDCFKETWISELLGKETNNTTTHSQSKGKSGSFRSA